MKVYLISCVMALMLAFCYTGMTQNGITGCLCATKVLHVDGSKILFGYIYIVYALVKTEIHAWRIETDTGHYKTHIQHACTHARTHTTYYTHKFRIHSTIPSLTLQLVSSQQCWALY